MNAMIGRRPRRVLKLCEDEAKILEAINAYLPAVHKHSWALSRQVGSGGYFRIGNINVGARLWDAILKRNGVQMAEHYRKPYHMRPAKDFRLIKLRFGETKVERLFGGAAVWSDKVEAKEFYCQAAAAAVQAVVALIDGGPSGLAAAIAEKKRRRSMGDI